jgi:predicted phosphoribosyltransferase
MVFADRASAGAALAALLEPALLPDPARLSAAGGAAPRPLVVLAIPRGGVPVAAVIAQRLRAHLDVLVAHKVGAPGEPELAIGAVAADGSVRQEEWAPHYATDEAFTIAAAAEVERARARETDLRGRRSAPELEGATVVLVDDGIATGSTMLVAIEAVRRDGAQRVIVAVPVAAGSAMAVLRASADDVVAILVPAHFSAVGEWYDHFDQVGDQEIRALLAAAYDASPGGAR